jgi:hypothetical protein
MNVRSSLARAGIWVLLTAGGTSVATRAHAQEAAEGRAAPPVAEPESAPAASVVPAPAQPSTKAPSETSWFSRPSMTLSAGEGDNRFSLTLFGFVEADAIVDSTRSYDDAIGSALVARSDTYAGKTGRTQFSMRNTRLGFALESPMVGGIKPIALIEGDFFGHQESAPGGSESTFFNSPTYRLRQAYLKLKNAYVDVLVGQTYDVFGWQNYFFPCTAEFLGLPNQVFSRNAQIRFSKTINTEGAVGVEVAASAVRPGQRDSQIPDGHAGIRLMLNNVKGIATPGNVGTTTVPLSVGVSGVVRQFKANAFTPPPAQASNSTTGWGISLDAFLPIIPAASAHDRSNRLAITGSFVKGTGIADLMTTGGGARFPTLPNPAQANPPPVYDADIDDGLVSFDAQGVLHTIDWTAMRAGLQYYLPGGRVIFAANVTQSTSGNIAKLFPKGGSEIELLGSVAKTSRYADANLFFDVTPAVRMGLSGQYTEVEYLDGNKPHNLRGMFQSVYVF